MVSLEQLSVKIPIPVAARYKAWNCGRSLPGIVGSNPAGGVNVCSCECYVLSGGGRHSSREVLPSVVCLSCGREASTMRRP